jgi:Ca2+-binding RTX toxin-like protein
MADFTGTSGNDDFTGTADNDLFDLEQGGDDTALGRAGNDEFLMGTAFNSADSINGGGGLDRVRLDGLSGDDSLVMNATTMLNFEEMFLEEGFTASIVTHDDTVAAGKHLSIIGQEAGNGLTGFIFDGSAETDGTFDMIGSEQNDILLGGAGGDTIDGSLGDDAITGYGGKNILSGESGNDSLIGKGRLDGGIGQDELYCGAGKQKLVFEDGGDSSSTTYDFAFDFNADKDKIDVSIAVTNVVTDSGTVNFATFDSDLASEANDWTGAKVFTVTGGDVIGRVFLLIDLNGSVSYEAGTDLVIDITGFSGTVDTSDFI